MPKEKGMLLMLKGMLSEATPEEQAQVAAAAEELRAVVDKHGDLGRVALSLVSLEMSIED